MSITHLGFELIAESLRFGPREPVDHRARACFVQSARNPLSFSRILSMRFHAGRGIFSPETRFILSGPSKLPPASRLDWVPKSGNQNAEVSNPSSARHGESSRHGVAQVPLSGSWRTHI
ncbi:hypothetical protein EMIT0111MI5_20047 [Burkholderia sp. IT-111MI5]